MIKYMLSILLLMSTVVSIRAMESSMELGSDSCSSSGKSSDSMELGSGSRSASSSGKSHADSSSCEGEEKDSSEDIGIWDQVQSLADGVVGQLGQLPVGGQLLGNTYKEHRYHRPYKGDCHLGKPAIFAESILSAHVDDRSVVCNSGDNRLKIIGAGLTGGDNCRKCLFGAIATGGCVYSLITNDRGEVVEIEKLLIHNKKSNPVFFVYDTLLVQREGEKILRSFQGDELVTDNGQPDGQPRIYMGQLIFKRIGVVNNRISTYVDKNGHSFVHENGDPLTEKDLAVLSTIDAQCYPKMAVSVVLTGTAGAGLGAGVVVRKVVNWGYRKIFGRSRANTSKNSKNKKEKNKKEKKTDKQESHEKPAQKPPQQSESSVKKATILDILRECHTEGVYSCFKYFYTNKIGVFSDIPVDNN